MPGVIRSCFGLVMVVGLSAAWFGWAAPPIPPTYLGPVPPSTNAVNWSTTNVTLAWDPVTNAVGYRVYWGAISRGYSRVTNATVCQASFPLPTNKWTFCAVTALSASGLESDYSKELVVVRRARPLTNCVVEVSVLGGGYTNVWGRFTNVVGTKLFRTRRDGSRVWMQVSVGSTNFYDVDVVRTNVSAGARIWLGVTGRHY